MRCAVAAGRDQIAGEVAAELAEGARRSPTDGAAGAALLCRGLVQQDPELLVEAVARYRRTALRPDLAACCEDAAVVLAAGGRRDEAVALLEEAATIHLDIEAAADAARVGSVLGELGARRARPRAKRPAFGWESLTPMETEVSRLVAEGLTNPEIGARLYVSRRTVETHLSHVFRKLGLTSRTQLAAELSGRAVRSRLEGGSRGDPHAALPRRPDRVARRPPRARPRMSAAATTAWPGAVLAPNATV